MKTDRIQIRDPFVVPDERERAYYLFGTTNADDWADKGPGFDCYRSGDLVEWEGPTPAFRPPPGFWGTRNFWAPEVHRHGDRFFMFASFKADSRCRGTQVLAADALPGPYAPWSDGPITPPEWECLDGTLHLDPDGDPWIVFCHEWLQVHNGAIWAMRLAPDLKRPAGRPVFLFNASEAPWVLRPGWPAKDSPRGFPDYITDGPFLHRLGNGTLLMLWSSRGAQGYAMGVARSETGLVTGPWTQEPEALWAADGGHGMIFRTFDGRLMLTLHRPNRTPAERPVFIEIEETAASVRARRQEGIT